MALETQWRGDIAGLTYIETSTLWRQEHNGYSHQNPGVSFVSSDIFGIKLTYSSLEDSSRFPEAWLGSISLPTPTRVLAPSTTVFEPRTTFL
jgi:hypothetical protein